MLSTMAHRWIGIHAALVWALVLAAAGTALAQPAPARGSYTGPGSCAAASCHGSVKPVSGSRILQNEYSTWILQDTHAKATENLTNAVSLRMARILGLPRPDTAPKCLACHALDVPEAQRAKTFANDGVSCEACHGPASGWLGPHTTRGWTHAQSLELGMYDTKDLVKRTERCASCHIGSDQKSVDHEMIAAGHPDLVFDLGAFSNAMPRHWQDPPANDRWSGVRTWSVGQLTQLREGLERLGRRTKGPVWPEYAELDCFSCHHNLLRPEESWRQELGYQNRRAGNPPWNHAPFAVARIIARDIDPVAADRLDADVGRLAQEVSKLDGNRTRIGEIVTGLRAELDGVARRATTRPADAATTLRLIRAIINEPDRIANHGERAAEQAAMSLETLFGVYGKNARDVDDKGVRAALDRLYQQLENPSAYDPRRFAAQLNRVNEVLPRAPGN